LKLGKATPPFSALLTMATAQRTLLFRSENPVTVDKELYMPENNNSIDDQMSVSPGDLG
tara:strand:- start:3400 stop:3576 length:177 start_codon:yes stop_codon:yes gene_type:complete